MKTAYVVDASVAVKWFVPEIHSEHALRLLRRKIDLQAPELIQAEFGNILWKKCRAGEFDGATGGEILDSFKRSPLVVHPHGAFLKLAWEIALKHRQTFYDSLYLALAMTGKSRMITADRKFYNALAGTPAERHLLWIEDVT
ncbi:MAG: type II toxin-antitoxin system VapC family toxin [Deltaproteobacteria bacterium]|nr:type II toxin-antitoxin system VapC family toxin [Deltaproteobacteria bacterium]